MGNTCVSSYIWVDVCLVTTHSITHTYNVPIDDIINTMQQMIFKHMNDIMCPWDEGVGNQPRMWYRMTSLSEMGPHTCIVSCLNGSMPADR